MRRLRGQRAARPDFESCSGSLSAARLSVSAISARTRFADEHRLGPAEPGDVVVDRHLTFEVQVVAVSDRIAR